ncbi:glycosyl hydrolase BNR repeat-containing protein [Striga asiatica]|uniref:Glycosyl hydrolase BNR repeat-containing protein n=1 Tax=Striga asiatica TaxID=4170 RepID=A0A5A7PFP7_STRAF|nr:glycosyl hydrolase BNR repeat-containing protein [Striga asiatica]
MPAKAPPSFVRSKHPRGPRNAGFMDRKKGLEEGYDRVGAVLRSEPSSKAKRQLLSIPCSTAYQVSEELIYYLCRLTTVLNYRWSINNSSSRYQYQGKELSAEKELTLALAPLNSKNRE